MYCRFYCILVITRFFHYFSLWLCVFLCYALGQLFLSLTSGKHDIVCLEDLVHEIFTPDSDNFRTANDFLHNFKLNAPTNGYRNRNKHFKDGGDFGCRFDAINPLIKTLI